MSYVIVGWLALDVGFLFGWCLRVAFTRGPLPNPGTGIIARWE